MIPSLDPAARIALTVNLLTEDNLPLYFAELNRLGKDDVWGEWARRWTAEEGRHSIVIRDYLMVTRAIDPVALERARMRQVCSGTVPVFGDVTEALIYTTLQELATRISHRNTGKLLTDAVGVAVMNRVASDENLHHLFYRDLASPRSNSRRRTWCGRWIEWCATSRCRALTSPTLPAMLA